MGEVKCVCRLTVRDTGVNECKSLAVVPGAVVLHIETIATAQVSENSSLFQSWSAVGLHRGRGGKVKAKEALVDARVGYVRKFSTGREGET